MRLGGGEDTSVPHVTFSSLTFHREFLEDLTGHTQKRGGPFKDTCPGQPCSCRFTLRRKVLSLFLTLTSLRGVTHLSLPNKTLKQRNLPRMTSGLGMGVGK